MDKKFLAEYSSREHSEYRQYVIDSIKDPSQSYPKLSRFGDVKYPIVHSEPHIFNYEHEKIWSQIPFAGTLIISLLNVSKENCLVQNGFESSDISQLIQLSKETGKIKFALQTDPLKFEGLDYLSPILEEFQPPVLYSVNMSQLISDEKKRDSWYKEFFKIASHRYIPELRNNVLAWGGNENFVNALIGGRSMTWERMNVLNMNEEIKHLSQLMIDSPEEAESLFSSYIMALSPIFDPLTKNYNYSLSRLQEFNVDSKNKQTKIRIPEIGKLILKKLVLNPSSYYGCIDTIQKYQDNDLYKLLDSFEKSLTQKKFDTVTSTREELDILMGNVWDDVKKTSSQIRDVKTGLTFIFGLGGASMTSSLQSVSDPISSSIAALSGLMAGLGFDTFESRFGLKKGISERFVKLFKTGYMINIFDFTKKYDIK